MGIICYFKFTYFILFKRRIFRFMEDTAYSNIFISKTVKYFFLPRFRSTQYDNIILK